MANARPRCPECDTILVQDEAMADLWNCAACGVSMLKLGSEWLTQIDPPVLSIAEFLPQGEARKAA
jgi:ribosomal protein L37AE/L43A